MALKTNALIRLAAMAGLVCFAGIQADAVTRIEISDLKNHSEVKDLMRDQLIAALVKTGRYDVVRQATARPSYHIEAELTDYGSGGEADNGMIHAKKVIVGLSFRITDLRTNQPVDSFQTNGERFDGGTTPGDETVRGAGFGTADWFQYDPLGQATKDALDYAVAHILSDIPDTGDTATNQPAVAQPTLIFSGYVCPNSDPITRYLSETADDFKGQNFVDCRPLQVLKGTHRVKVLNLGDAEEQVLDMHQIRRLSPLDGAPAIGAQVLVSCNTEGVIPSGSYYIGKYPHIYIACKVADLSDQAAMLVCHKVDLTIPFTALFTAKPVADIQAAVANQ